MPISINNSFLSVYLHIESITDDENKIRILVDTGAAMNTGNNAYHQRVMSQSPSMIAEYLERGADNEYDVAQLIVALNLKET